MTSFAIIIARTLKLPTTTQRIQFSHPPTLTYVSVEFHKKPHINTESSYGTSCSLNLATGSRGEVSQGMGPGPRARMAARSCSMMLPLGRSLASVGFETVRVVQCMESVAGASPMGVRTALGFRISLIKVGCVACELHTACDWL